MAAEVRAPDDLIAAETRDTRKHKVLGTVLAWVMRLIDFSSRTRLLGVNHMRDALKSGRPVIIVSWHDRNILAYFTYAHAAKGIDRRLIPLVSASRDGGMAASAMASLGVQCLRGSSSRGGVKALKSVIRQLKKGDVIAFTPDGPRGPRHHVQGGVVTAAKLSGALIVPMTYYAKRHKLLRSWDRMMVPYPFNRINHAYGAPIEVPPKTPAAELPRYLERVRLALLEIGERAEQFP